ncbi:tetratricopeptide repeat protein [Bacteroidales bacterium OttesenSCG-928-M11]|nr:tetratricopeptide repeat protein [Bacteroidales bacterium OttesenSCG-928-M11]
MRKFVFTLSLCMLATVAFGQKKQLNDIKKDLKEENPNITSVRNSMQQVLENEETKDWAESWYTAGLVENKQYDMEKLKIINGGKANDQVMYKALDAIYPFFLKAYELDNMPNEKGKVKPKYTKDIRAVMKSNRIDYVNAGTYFYNLQNWQKAYDNFRMFIDMPELPMMEGEVFEPFEDDTTTFLQVKYYSALAALGIPNHDAAVKALSDLQGTGYEQERVYQLLTEEYQRVGDTINYHRMLEESHLLFPGNSFFILNLINIALEAEDSKKAIGYLTSAIENTGDDAFLYNILGQVYREIKEYDKSIESLKKAIELDSYQADIYAQLGYTYFMIAEDTRLESEKETGTKADELYKKSLELYKEAIPSYEKAIQIDSKNANAVTNLRFIFYITNDPQFDKLDKMYEAL